MKRSKILSTTDKESTWCFGCGKDNPFSLKLDFQWDGRIAKAEFIPAKLHEGWPGIVHGGIITTILDEAMSYATIFEGTNCVTAEIRVNFKRPVLVDEPLTINSSVTKKTRKIVETEACILSADGTLLAEGTAIQFIIKHLPKSSNKEEIPKK
ncbi:MAG: PaaI family thioesterase [Dehalococcoidales bacterium]|nr:PaaI family thioesterase [Dehalococcoidales bacterium]